MSFLSRFWNSIRNPVRYIGRDLEGNKFFETRSLNDPQRTKRTVQYYDPEDMWKYIGGGKRLAIQWSAWLTHTRPHPPTIQELQVDMTRQQRVLANAAMIEARDRAESEEMLRIRQADAHQALEEAAARSQGVLQQPPSEPTPAESSGMSEDTTPRTDIQMQTPSSVSASNTTQATPKVLPPKFLTPATPRMSRTSSKFAMPSADIAKGGLSQDLQTERPQPSGSQPQERTDLNSNPPSPMPSRPPSETESWTPKARRRG